MTRYRKFGPKPADHPSIGRSCAACGKPFAAGDETSLAELWPGDIQEWQRMRQGRPYTAAAAEVHWGCLPPYLQEPDDTDEGGPDAH